MVLVVAQFVLELHEELEWRANRVAAKIEANIQSNIASVQTLKNGVLPAPTVPYAVPQIKKENTQLDKLVDKLDGRFNKQMFDQVVIGHVHMAKTSGTTLNGNLSMHFERVCGHKGYSYDAYQANIRFKTTQQDSVSVRHKDFSRLRVPAQLMDEIGYENCDWISNEISWSFWKRFAFWPVPVQLHVPCRDPIDHLMSQCNHVGHIFDCSGDLDAEIRRCNLGYDRFSNNLLTTHSNIQIKCFDWKASFDGRYYDLMRLFLQPRKLSAKYEHRPMNKKRKRQHECVWNNSAVQQKIKNYLSQNFDYPNFCSSCMGTKNDLFHASKTVKLQKTATQIVAFSDRKFMKLAKQWYENMQLLGYNELTIIAIDEPTYNFFQQIGSKVELELISGKSNLWSTRLKVLDRKLAAGHSVLLVDVDNIFFRYVPMSVFESSNVSAAFMKGTTWPLDVYKKQGFVVCAGLSWWSADSQLALNMVRRIRMNSECHEDGADCDDQREINRDLLNQKMIWHKTNEYGELQGTSLLSGMNITVWDSNFAWRGKLNGKSHPDFDDDRLWVAHPVAEKARDSLERENLKEQLSIQSHSLDKKGNIVMFSMVTLDILNNTVNTGNERRLNVEKSLNVWPKLQTFNASYQLDESCISVLRQMKIRISEEYYSDEKGVGWIHAGKVGHWCSFLRYLWYCKQSGAVVCVWIEDDFSLSPANIGKIEAEAMQIATSPAKHSIVSLGLGDEVNVIDARKLDNVLHHFSNFEISKPLDHTLGTAQLGVAKRVFTKEDRIFVGKTSSTLVCPTCKIQTVSSINAQISTTG